jgi:hypothetical protein
MKIKLKILRKYINAFNGVFFFLNTSLKGKIGKGSKCELRITIMMVSHFFRASLTFMTKLNHLV